MDTPSLGTQPALATQPAREAELAAPAPAPLRPLRFYVAGAYVDAPAVKARAEALKALGHTITTEWWNDDCCTPPPEAWRAWMEYIGNMAHKDLVLGVGCADAVLVLFTAADDSYAYNVSRSEVAYALGAGIPVVAVAPVLVKLVEDDAATIRTEQGKREFTGPAYANSFVLGAKGVVLCATVEEGFARVITAAEARRAANTRL